MSSIDTPMPAVGKLTHFEISAELKCKMKNENLSVNLIRAHLMSICDINAHYCIIRKHITQFPMKVGDQNCDK